MAWSIRASPEPARTPQALSPGPDKDISQGKGSDIGRSGSENRRVVGFQRRSKRSRFITLTHAFPKSSMNFC